MVVMAPFGDNALDDKAGTAEVVPGKLPDTHDLRCQPPFGELPGQDFSIEHLVEPDSYYVRLDLLYWQEHIGMVTEHCMIHRF